MEEFACKLLRLINPMGEPGEPGEPSSFCALYSLSSSIRLGKVSELRNNESTKFTSVFTTGMIMKNIQKLSQFYYFSMIHLLDSCSFFLS